jgi:hypothetical protein
MEVHIEAGRLNDAWDDWIQVLGCAAYMSELEDAQQRFSTQGPRDA